MISIRDPSLQSALLMGARVLALTAVLGGAATLAFLQVRVDRDAEPARVPPRVAAPVLLPVAEPPAPPVQAAPRAPSAAPARVWLLDLGAPSRPLTRDAGAVQAGALCSALSEAGWAMSGWSEDAMGGSTRECIGERRFPAGAGTDTTNAFAILRGDADGALRELRIKLNVLDEATAGEATNELVRALDAVFAALRWDLSAAIREAVGARRPVTLDEAGTSLRFWRESGEPARYNLRLTVPAPPDPADRFTSRDSARAGGPVRAGASVAAGRSGSASP